MFPILISGVSATYGLARSERPYKVHRVRVSILLLQQDDKAKVLFSEIYSWLVLSTGNGRSVSGAYI